ncbi:MAG TPA: serine/threonine-protein kinase, partial [Ktedonobacterales bacterium]
EQTLLKTQAAIKVLRAQLDDQKAEQFRFEADRIARLDHPYIARLQHFGIENNSPYLVTDYTPNGSLRQRHPRGVPLPVGIVVRYAQQVAEALDHAHQQKIIHRNVKPENLLVGKKNEILLSDFGIAIVTHQAPATEDSGDTLSYIAPEQLRRKPHPASDQYALAVMVYEWLTGRLPFRGSALDVARQHLEVPPPSMREPGSAFSADVERVVLRGLEKHWQMRYPGAREFANALHDAHFPHPPFTRVYE